MRTGSALALATSLLCCVEAQAGDWTQVLRDGFDGTDFAEAGGLYYKDNFEQSAGTVSFQKDVTRDGSGALKLSVKPICPVSDDACSDRAEVWEKTALRVPYDQGVWYGFAVKFGDPIPQDDHRYLIAQWKREINAGADGDFSPFLALRLRNGKLFATVETNYIEPKAGLQRRDARTCPDGATPVWLRPESNQMRALVSTEAAWTEADGALYNSCTDAIKIQQHGEMPTAASGWIDFAIYTKPGPDGSGRIDIYANGKPIVTVTGHIGHADKDLGDNQYFKFGPYRAAHTNEWTLYYDDFRRSPNCADVLVGGDCPAS